MTTETLTRSSEQLETTDPLIQLEEIIEAAAANLSPNERALLESPRPMPNELQLADPEAKTSEQIFGDILKGMPETETPNHSHGMKINIVHEPPGAWNYKGL